MHRPHPPSCARLHNHKLLFSFNFVCLRVLHGHGCLNHLSVVPLSCCPSSLHALTSRGMHPAAMQPLWPAGPPISPLRAGKRFVYQSLFTALLRVLALFTIAGLCLCKWLLCGAHGRMQVRALVFVYSISSRWCAAGCHAGACRSLLNSLACV